jgi:hypothetical protein
MNDHDTYGSHVTDARVAADAAVVRAAAALRPALTRAAEKERRFAACSPNARISMLDKGNQ